MPEKSEIPRFLKLPFAFGVALLYAVVALLWIYFSDRSILVLAQDQGQLLLYSTFKGWGYVLLTAGLLYLVLRRFVARIGESQQQLRYSSERYSTILDNVDAAIYIADFDTHELLFVNEHLRKIVGDEVEGKPCWQVLQNEGKPCSFCNNAELLDAQGNPTGVVRSEFQNTIDKRWYDIRDQAITWIDGRRVRLEIAV
ncbi:MAG: PAS domain-containing protein, partial [Desulfuromonadaceae bacterium]